MFTTLVTVKSKHLLNENGIHKIVLEAHNCTVKCIMPWDGDWGYTIGWKVRAVQVAYGITCDSGAKSGIGSKSMC